MDLFPACKQDQPLVKRTYGRKKAPQLVTSEVSKRRESNTNLSSLFFYPNRNNTTNLFSPFKSLQKYINLPIKNVFDLIPDLSPIQINASSKLENLKKRPKTKPQSQALESVTIEQDQSTPEVPMKENDINFTQSVLSVHEKNAFSEKNFCQSNVLPENPFIEYSSVNIKQKYITKEKDPTELFFKYDNNTATEANLKGNRTVEVNLRESRASADSTLGLMPNKIDGAMELEPSMLKLLLHACDQESVLDFGIFISEFK